MSIEKGPSAVRVPKIKIKKKYFLVDISSCIVILSGKFNGIQVCRLSAENYFCIKGIKGKQRKFVYLRSPMKNICLLLLLLPLFSYGQQFKSSVSWLFHHSNDTRQLVDSCEYNEKGMLIFRRDYNLFKEKDYEDKRYTYNSAGKLVKTVSYDVAGQP